MYKSSFNGLEISVKGVYHVYNLSQEELEIIRRTFGVDSINGSNGNYTIFKNAERHVYLRLFIHDLWKPIQVDIRDDLLVLYKTGRIYKKDIDYLSKRLHDMRLQLHVEYISGYWSIVNYHEFIELVAQIISENKKNTG